MNQLKKRVVVTGLGTLNPLGVGLEKSWNNLLKGKSALQKIPEIEGMTDKQKNYLVGGLIPEEAVSEEFREENKIRMADDLYYQVNYTFKMALRQAGLEYKGSSNTKLLSAEERERFALLFGIYNNNPEGTNVARTSRGAGLIKATPFAVVGAIALQMQITGYSAALLNGSLKPVGDGYRLIKDGYQDRALAGGFDLNTDTYIHAGLVGQNYHCSVTPNIEESMKPFDKNTTGTCLGDGGSVILLEELETAQKRGANILCEVVGYDSNTHFSDSHIPQKETIEKMFANVLKQTGWKPEDIDLVNCAGLGIKESDQAEVAALKSVLGSSGKAYVNALKGYMGNLTFGAAPTELAFLMYGLSQGIVPASANLKDPIDKDLNFVLDKQHVEKKIDKVIKIEYDLGPYNQILAFQRFKQ